MSDEAVQNQALQNQALQNQALQNQALQNQALQNQPAQLAFEPLPSMNDLDALQIDLDQVDRVLADLDNERPVGATPNPSQ